MSRWPSSEEEVEVEVPRGWDASYIVRLAEQLVAHPTLLEPVSHNSHHSQYFYKQRRKTLDTVARALAPPLVSIHAMRRRVSDFRRIYFDKIRNMARDAVRKGSKKRVAPLPRWMRLVEPLLRAAPEHARLLAAPDGEPDASAAAVDGVLAALTERARALRTVHPARVCRDLPGAGCVAPSVLHGIWARMQSAVRAKLEMLIGCGDSEAGLAEGARLSPSEWRLLDAVLLYEPELQVVEERHLRTLEPLQVLVAVFHLAQLFRLEEGGSWRAAHLAYRRRGLQGSVVLLQRRWHALKQAARHALVAAARGAGTAHVCPLHTAIARRFPLAVTVPLPTWSELVTSGAVLEEYTESECEETLDVGEVSARLTLVSQARAPAAGAHSTREEKEGREEDDDLILIDQEIETVDLLAAEEGEVGGGGVVEGPHSPPSHAEDFRAVLRHRRRNIARALQDELEHQLRDLEENRPGAASGDSDSDEAVLVKTEPPSDEEHGASRRDERYEESDDEHVDIDPKLLMSTTVSLVRVDSTRVWRRRARGAALHVAGLDVRALAPPVRDRNIEEPEEKMMSNIKIVKVEAECKGTKPRSNESSGRGGMGRRKSARHSEDNFDDHSCSGEGAEGSGSGGEEARVRKRVLLPDIAEVRRINQGMLTAQVAPLSAVDAPVAAARAPSRTCSEESTLCIDEDGGGGEAEREECTLSFAELSALLERISRRNSTSAPLAGAAAHCCEARRHRAINDARRRNAARAGRPPPADVQLHAGRCPRPGRACACCCKHLLDAEGAARVLTDTQRRLRDDISAVLAGTGGASPQDESGNVSEDKSADSDKTYAPSKSNRASACGAARKRPSRINKRKREKSSDTDSEPRTDPLQEWIRQKNITSRFFNLNLKRPAPAPRPAAAPAPTSAPVAVLHVTPSISDNTAPVASPTNPSPPQASPTNQSPTHPRSTHPSPTKPSPTRSSPTNSSAGKRLVIFPVNRVMTNKCSSILNNNVLSAPATAAAPAGGAPGSLLQRIQGAGGLAHLQNVIRNLKAAPGAGDAVPVTLVPLQDGGGIRLVPVHVMKGAPAPATFAAPAVFLPTDGAGVIDLCDDSDEDAGPLSLPAAQPSPPPPAPTPAATLASKNKDILVRLPPGISVSRKQPPTPEPPMRLGNTTISRVPRAPVPPPAPAPVPTPAPAPRHVLLNERMARPARTLELSPIEGGKSNIKVFKISEDGLLTQTSALPVPAVPPAHLAPFAQPSAHVVPLAPPSAHVAPRAIPPAPASTRGALGNKQINKIVLVPRGAESAGGTPRSLLKMTRAPPVLPRPLSDVVVATPALPAPPASPAAVPGLKIAEAWTKDGRRMLVMRRSAVQGPAVPPLSHGNKIVMRVPSPAPGPHGPAHRDMRLKGTQDVRPRPVQPIPPPEAGGVCPQAASKESVTSMGAVRGRMVALADELKNCGSYPHELSGFSDLEVSVSEWVKGRDRSTLMVQCLDRAVPYYSVLGKYYVVSERELDMGQPSYWTPGASATARRLVLPPPAVAPVAMLAALPDHTYEAGRVFKKLSDNPLIYACVVYVVRDVAELATLLREGADLHVVHMGTGATQPLKLAIAPDPAARLEVQCDFRAAAAALEISLDLGRLERREQLSSVKAVQNPKTRLPPPALVRIAPLPKQNRAREPGSLVRIAPRRTPAAAPAQVGCPAPAPAPARVVPCPAPVERPSRRAARDARAKLVDMLKEEESAEGGAGGREYLVAHEQDADDDDDDYDAPAGVRDDSDADNEDDDNDAHTRVCDDADVVFVDDDVVTQRDNTARDIADEQVAVAADCGSDDGEVNVPDCDKNDIDDTVHDSDNDDDVNSHNSNNEAGLNTHNSVNDGKFPTPDCDNDDDLNTPQYDCDNAATADSARGSGGDAHHGNSADRDGDEDPHRDTTAPDSDDEGDPVRNNEGEIDPLRDNEGGGDPLRDNEGLSDPVRNDDRNKPRR